MNKDNGWKRLFHGNRTGSSGYSSDDDASKLPESSDRKTPDRSRDARGGRAEHLQAPVPAPTPPGPPSPPSPPPDPAGVRRNFSVRVNDALNRAMNREFCAAYTYLSISAYLASPEAGLRGFARYFRQQSDEERSHGQKIMDYIVSRGGQLRFDLVASAEVTPRDWLSGRDGAVRAFKRSLELEHDVNAGLLDVHRAATEEEDPSCTDFLEDMLQHQKDEIRDVGEMITRLERMQDTQLCVHLIDQELLKKAEEEEGEKN